VHEHRVIHRDVKPSNIYLTASGGVKLLDFGVAKLADLTLTATGQLCGTPAYMAPEQLRSAEVSPATDVFALGVVAYRVYSGAMPWNGESLHSLMMAICVSPPRPFREAARANDRFGLGEERIEMLHAIIHRAIEAEPSRRFSSAFELAGAFEDFLLGRTDHPTLAPQAGPSRWSNQQIEWARARAARVELDQTGETADLADRSTTANVIDREDRGWPKMYVALLVVFGLALILVSWLLIAGG
jgi:serine/threonine protein kinase